MWQKTFSPVSEDFLDLIYFKQKILYLKLQKKKKEREKVERMGLKEVLSPYIWNLVNKNIALIAVTNTTMIIATYMMSILEAQLSVVLFIIYLAWWSFELVSSVIASSSSTCRIPVTKFPTNNRANPMMIVKTSGTRFPTAWSFLASLLAFMSI